MSEIKGLLWYSLAQTTMIMSVLFFIIGIKLIYIYVLFGFATIDTIFGVLEWFEIIEKIRRNRLK